MWNMSVLEMRVSCDLVDVSIVLISKLLDYQWVQIDRL